MKNIFAKIMIAFLIVALVGIAPIYAQDKPVHEKKCENMSKKECMKECAKKCETDKMSALDKKECSKENMKECSKESMKECKKACKLDSKDAKGCCESSKKVSKSKNAKKIEIKKEQK